MKRWRTLPSGTRIHVPNMRKLSAFLRTLSSTEWFDMGLYHSGAVRPTTEHPCGTSACAVGWAPAAGIPITKSDSDWVSYCSRTLISTSGEEWRWCFAPRWARLDNTPAGAAARIDWLLDHGLPDDSYDQRIGLAPLCYTVPA